MDNSIGIGGVCLAISLLCLWVIVTMQGCELRQMREALTAGPVVEQEVE